MPDSARAIDFRCNIDVFYIIKFIVFKINYKSLKIISFTSDRLYDYSKM